MKGIIRLLLCSLMMLTVSSIATFAGQWKRDARGWWFQMDDGSYISNGTATINGTMYCFDKNGYLRENQWVLMQSGKWRYCMDGGAVATSQWIDGTYYVDSDGLMMTNAWTPDGYWVGADGKYVKGEGESSTQVFKYYITYDSSVAGHFQSNNSESGKSQLTMIRSGNRLSVKETGKQYELSGQRGSINIYTSPIIVGGTMESVFLTIDEISGICTYSDDPYDIRLDYFIISTRSPDDYYTTLEDVLLKSGSVSTEKAKQIAYDYWNIQPGQIDRETGFEMWIDEPVYMVSSITGRGYYAVTLYWFVKEGNRGHRSTLDRIYIDADTGVVNQQVEGLI